MEQQMFPIKVSIVLLAFLLFVIKTMNGRKAKLPPGPFKLPIIGNLNQILSPMPHHTLRDLANKYGPIMYLKLGHVKAIIISSAEVSREIMKTHDHMFTNRPKVLSAEILAYNCTDIGYAPYGPYWRQMRKICVLELLSTTRVQSFRSVREEEVSLLISSIASESPSPVNMTQKLFSLVHDITSRIAFGKRNHNPEKFRDVTKEAVALAGGFDIGDFFPSLAFVRAISGMKSRLERNFIEYDSIMSEIIENHMKEETSKAMAHEDLVDVLLRVQKNGDLEFPLTNDNIKAVLLDVFIGGSETTSITMEWAMVEMIRNPRVLQKAQEEIRRVMGVKTRMDESDIHQMDYLKLVVRETLRLHPPLPLLIPRETTERCMINGYEIPAKTRVIVNNWAISRDPRCWEVAETFYPERFCDKDIDFKGQSFEYIPFGGGRRGCPGITFGLANIELALASLLFYFDWELPHGQKPEDLDQTESFGVTVTRKSNLHLVLTPRFLVPTHQAI